MLRLLLLLAVMRYVYENDIIAGVHKMHIKMVLCVCFRCKIVCRLLLCHIIIQ